MREALLLTFTTYPKACGWAKNGDIKLGAASFELYVAGPTVSAMTYGPNEVGANILELPPSTDAGACSYGSGTSTPGTPPSGTGITITTIDATHVAGTFSFTPQATTVQISGNFDLPICSPTAGLSPPTCCLP